MSTATWWWRLRRTVTWSTSLRRRPPPSAPPSWLTRTPRRPESQAQADQRALTLAALRSVDRQLRELPRRQRGGDAATDLREKRDTLQTLADAGVGSPQIIQPGYPPENKSGSPLETILLGALFGLILGVGLALLRDQMDRRLHHAAEVSTAFDAPVLTTVPRNRKLKRNVPFGRLPADVAESFRMLQMNLRFGPEPPVRSVLVTSARTGEGKTTVAWNLACAAASSRVVGHARRG